ncbi:MAG: nucleotidyltransferase family protein [Clostridiales Family XIII bacterium]|jgi:CTP:molybdopterin cytidylyltransferase MocA|nr:nucleotidyltransferase family protein [Clostridiales Family XIII bacterium]
MAGNTGAVIVAAGLSSRMGDYKPLMEIGGVSIARRVVGAFLGAGVGPIVVVTGHRAAELEAHLQEFAADGAGAASDAGATSGAAGCPELLFVRNERYDSTTMFDSARIGLSYIAGRCARAFFTPVDVPLFTADTVRALMACGADIVKPVYKGREGHPILVGAGLIPEIVGTEEPGGLKAALEKYEARTARVEVSDEGVLYDADTPDEFNLLMELSRN